jgi:integrase
MIEEKGAVIAQMERIVESAADTSTFCPSRRTPRLPAEKSPSPCGQVARARPSRPGSPDDVIRRLAFAAGMRVSELVGLRFDQIDRQGVSTVPIIGKGRRKRILPLRKETAAAVKAWLKVRPASAAPELFLNARGQAMTRDGFEYILAKHVATASRAVPSIAGKRSVHTCCTPAPCIRCRRLATCGKARSRSDTPAWKLLARLLAAEM